jgi:hypothetical protein
MSMIRQVIESPLVQGDEEEMRDVKHESDVGKSGV